MLLGTTAVAHYDALNEDIVFSRRALTKKPDREQAVALKVVFSLIIQQGAVKMS